MNNIGLLVIGVLIAVIGLVNISGNVSTIHSYHRKRVSEEDIPTYGKWMGTGTLIIGISVIIGFVLLEMNLDLYMGYCVAIGCVIGIMMMVYAQLKYNKGIF